MNEPETKQRILEAAGAIFAEHGFRASRVRDICAQAGVNGAAVNYHFGGKEALYAAAIRHACAENGHPPPPTDDTAPRERLQAFVAGMLARMTDPRRPAWQRRLLSREIAEPTAILDEVVERSIRPQFAFLAALVRLVLGDPDPVTVRRCVASIVGQCLFYHHAREVLARLHPDLRWDEAEIAGTAAHIARFSLAGIRASAPQERP